MSGEIAFILLIIKQFKMHMYEKLMKWTLSAIVGCALIATGSEFDEAQAQVSKDATEATKVANAAMRDSQPFSDQKSFEDARRSFVAPWLPAGL